MDREKVIKGLECHRIDNIELLKEQEAETIECKMCGHRLQKDWNWCPWCRWEIRQGYNAD